MLLTIIFIEHFFYFSKNIQSWMIKSTRYLKFEVNFKKRLNLK
jgi:hypothetical protein